uniref:Ig-like domain-containing protein n=1 Tax=Naja naja TaxID=35670 RepID=A0A8C6X9S4_NAJNA
MLFKTAPPRPRESPLFSQPPQFCPSVPPRGGGAWKGVSRRNLLFPSVSVRLLLGASSHSLKFFFTAISEPSQGQPHFVSVGYMDGQVFVHYNSHDRMVTPRVSWIEKYVGKEDPKYWDINSRKVRGSETMFRKNLEILRRRYNQSEGSHIIQWMYGCELRRDGSKGGFNQYGYDGSTFLTFDKATLTWVAPDPQAQITQRKWDAIPRLNQKRKTYLEEICINWIRKYLSYGNETLLRTVIMGAPKLTVRGKTEVEDGMETHVCHLDGFYPREIDASWTRDGEVWEEETFHGSVAPNADGTYHYWLSIWIDPKERGRYRCHVEHDSLQEPLALALEGERLQGGKRLGSLAGWEVVGEESGPRCVQKVQWPLGKNTFGSRSQSL